MIGNNMYLVTKEFIFPLEESLKYGDSLHLEHMVVVLSSHKFLRHEPGRSACPPGGALSIDAPYA
jgi:hypothetical protein